MNEKNSYEKYLAEQFEQLPPPGNAQSHWPQMKALLDKELPEGGGKRPGGFGRWGLYALVAGLIITATWWASNTYLSSGEDNNPSMSSNTQVPETTETKTGDDPSKSKTGINDNAEPIQSTASKNSTKNDADINTATPVKEKGSDSKVSSDDIPSNNVEETVKSENNSTIAVKKSGTVASRLVSKNDDAGKENENNSSKENTKSIEKNSTLNSKGTDGNTKKNFISSTAGKSFTLAGGEVASKSSTKKSIAENTVSRKKSSTSGNENNGFDGLDASGKNNKNEVPLSGISLPDNGSVKAKPAKVQSPMALLDRNQIGPAALWVDSMDNDYALLVEPVPVKLPAPSRFKVETARTRSLKNRIVGSGDDKQFVIGLSLPLAFPVGSQGNLAININGGANKISDFLPIPHFQYHFSDKAYLQTELQFIAPQYIQSALLFQTRREIASTSNYRFATSSIYAKKLYYFNLPVVAYYSPFKNFYLGTGIQYSKLLSGIALYEDKVATSLQPGARDSLYRSSYSKFRKDSVYNKLASHEFRFIFDANYYWHRFTVGMRYTQALSDFVSVRLNNNTPVYTDRNKSLQFYLRYNIWEDRRKKKPAMVAWR